MTDELVVLRMLGGVELLGPDGRPAREVLAQPRRLALLLYLAAANHAGFHRKDSVRALFWPEADAQHARQALNRAIYVLRQALGTDVLVTRGDDEVGIGERLWCDVSLFEQALEEGAPEAALELYRGDLAPGFLLSGLPELEQWMEATRARLRRRAVDAAMELADRAEAERRLEQAERWAHRAELLSPHDERATGRRIRLLDRMGDRAAALSAFEDLERRLREGLELEPSPETLALVGALRSRREPRRSFKVRISGSIASGISRVETLAQAVDAALTGSAGAGSGRRRLALIGVATLATAGVLSVLFHRPRSRMLTTANAIAITSEPGVEFQPALSPDGSLVAFARLAGQRTVVSVKSRAAAPGDGEIRPAANRSADQALPVWSADGERVRFVSIPHADVQLEPFIRTSARTFTWTEVGRLGGAERPVELPRQTQWTAWSRDGTRVAFAIQDSLFVYDFAQQRTRLLAVHPGGRSPHSLAWSPDGRWIAYVDGNPFWPVGWNTAPSAIWLVRSDRGITVPVTDQTHLNVSPAWLDARHLLFVSDLNGQRAVYTIEIGQGAPAGPPVEVPGTTDAHSISVSADGKHLAVAKLIARQNVRSFSLTAPRPLSAHEGEPVTSGSQVVETHDVSPDGHHLAYDSNIHGDADIYRMPLDGGAPVPLVTGPARAFSPHWSPDGREIAYYGGTEDDIWVVAAEGGTPTRVASIPGGGDTPIWSPDGLSLVFRSERSGRTEAWILTREGIGRPWSPARQLTDFGCAYQVWVRDGSGILCGRPEQTIVSLVSPTGALRWRRDLAPSGLSRLGPPALSPTDSTLYMRAARGGEAGIWALPLNGGEPRLIVTFDDPTFAVQSYPGTINVTRDRLYLTVGEFESDIWEMDLVRE